MENLIKFYFPLIVDSRHPSPISYQEIIMITTKYLEDDKNHVDYVCLSVRLYRVATKPNPVITTIISSTVYTLSGYLPWIPECKVTSDSGSDAIGAR